MRIVVNVKTSSRKESVERVSQPSLGLGDAAGEKVIYKVSVREAPVDGKANDAVTLALAEYLDMPKSLVILVSGHSYKQKIFEVPDSACLHAAVRA